MPLESPEARFAAPKADELPVGVDRVMVAGVRLRRPEALREPDEQDPDRAPGEAQVVRRVHVGEAGRGQAAVDVPHDRGAVDGQVEEVDRGVAEDHRDERRRHDRAIRRRPRTTASDTSPTASALPFVSSRSRTSPPIVSKKSPDVASTPKSFGSCPAMIVSASPNDEALQHGLGDEAGQEPRRISPAATPAIPVVIASAAVSATKLSVPCVAYSATAAAESAALADIGPTTRGRELPNAVLRSNAPGAA
jgi:hypothetical protein